MKQGRLFDAIESASTWTPSAPPSLDGIDEIALDAETTGLAWWNQDLPIGLAVGYKRGNEYITQYLPWAHRGGGNLSEDAVKRWAKRELRNKRIKNLNSRFDNHHVYKWGVDLEEQGCVWGDIGHYAALLDDHRRHGFSLDAISKDWIGEGKIKGLDVPNLADYHAGDVHEYAEQDVRLVLKVLDKMRPLLVEQELMTVADLEDEVIFAVCEMERNGAPIDVEKLDLWIAKSNTDLMSCVKQIYDLVGFRVDPSDRDDMVRLFRSQGLEIKKWTSGGDTRDPQPSFTDEVLAGIDNEAIHLVRRARRLMSLRSKYLLNYRDEIGSGNILRYALNQLKADKGGTISGRFSSTSMTKGEDGEGVNIQQVMRPDKHKDTFGADYIIRELFVPESGLWNTSDARQIEFRLFVHYSNSLRLIEEYRKNPDVDFHNIVWEIVKRFKAEFTRKSTKDVNFAELYGAGVFKTSQMLKLPMKQAKEFVEIYNQEFPEVHELRERAQNIAKKRGFVKTILGRRFHFPDGEFLHKALSRIIQGSAADVMKKKLVELHKASKKIGFKLRFIVHDEANGDVQDKEASRRVGELLNRQTIDFRVPITWQNGCGANWKEAK